MNRRAIANRIHLVASTPHNRGHGVMKNYLLLAGMFLLSLTIGCAAVPRSPVPESEQTALPVTSTKTSPAATTPSGKIAEPIKSAPGPTAKTGREAGNTAVPPTGDASSPQPPSLSRDELAVLVVNAGALITQVNGDTKLRCMQPDCKIPLPPGNHRVAVGYRDTATRSGSTVTYTSMFPRVVEITLEPGHRYSVTASGRYSQKWWIAIEDQTANKTVYNDRENPQP